MTGKLDPRVVLEHLNNLGYENITPQQLKEFMKDLKKLIKYECKQCCETHPCPSPPRDRPPSNRKCVACQGESVISLHVEKKKQSRPRCSCRKPRTPFPSEVTDDVSSHLRPSTVSTSQPGISRGSTEPSSVSFKQPDKKLPVNEIKRPKSSVIKTHIMKPVKSDPVTLYHQYKKEWEKVNFPGENDRAELRWNIRAKLLGEPHIYSQVPSRESLRRCIEKKAF